MKRFKIGDRVIYGGALSVVSDVRLEDMTGDAAEYYILSALGSKTESYTYIPTQNKKLTENMKPILTKTEARALYAEIPTVAPLDWINDNRRRSELFKEIMDSYDRRRVIAMIKSICRVELERQAKGKKNYLSDEHFLAKAERLLYSELTLILEKKEADISSLIRGSL